MRGREDRAAAQGLGLKGPAGASESTRRLGLWLSPSPWGGALPPGAAAWSDVLVASCLTPAVTFLLWGGAGSGPRPSGAGQEPHAGLGIRGQASTGPWCLPCCPRPPTLDAHVSSRPPAAPGQDCIILGFVRRAAGGGVGPAACHPPSPSSPSTPSWSIPLLPPLSSPWHPRNCLSYLKAVSSLSTLSCSPGSPRGYRSQRQREGS